MLISIHSNTFHRTSIISVSRLSLTLCFPANSIFALLVAKIGMSVLRQTSVANWFYGDGSFTGSSSWRSSKSLQQINSQQVRGLGFPRVPVSFCWLFGFWGGYIFQIRVMFTVVDWCIFLADVSISRVCCWSEKSTTIPSDDVMLSFTDFQRLGPVRFKATW